MNDRGNRSKEACDPRRRDVAFEMAGDDRSGFKLPGVAQQTGMSDALVRRQGVA